MKTYTEQEAKLMIEKLTPNQSMLTSIRKVAGGKFHLEIAEKIVKTTGAINLLSILNAGDDRFNSGGARRAWAPAEKAIIVEMFGIEEEKLDALSEGDKLYVCILNPNINGIQFRIQVRETVEGTDYDNANIESTAKRAGKDGEILTHEGLPIFSKTYVVGVQEGQKVVHTYLLSDQEMERQASGLVGSPSSPSATPSLD